MNADRVDPVNFLPLEVSQLLFRWGTPADLDVWSRVSKAWRQVIFSLPSPRLLPKSHGVHLPSNPKIGELRDLVSVVRDSLPQAATTLGEGIGDDPQVLDTDEGSFILSRKSDTIECHDLTGKQIWSIDRPGSGALDPRFTATVITTRNDEGQKTGQCVYFAHACGKGLGIYQWNPASLGEQPSDPKEQILRSGCSQLWSGQWGIAALAGCQLFCQPISSKGKLLESFRQQLGSNVRVVGECPGQLLVRTSAGFGLNYHRINAQGEMSSLANVPGNPRRTHYVYQDFIQEVIDPTNRVLFAYSSGLQPPTLFAFFTSTGSSAGKWQCEVGINGSVWRRLHSGLIGGRPAAILSAQRQKLQIARLPKTSTTRILPTESIASLKHYVQRPLLPQFGIFLTSHARSGHLVRMNATNEGQVKAESVKIADPLWQDTGELFLKQRKKASELFTVCKGSLYQYSVPTTQSSQTTAQHRGPRPLTLAFKKHAMVASIAFAGLVWLLLYGAVRRIGWNQLSWIGRSGVVAIGYAATFPAIYQCAKP